MYRLGSFLKKTFMVCKIEEKILGCVHINLVSKRTINEKVTILGSSGRPEKGNLIKHIHDDATGSYNNVTNWNLKL